MTEKCYKYGQMSDLESPHNSIDIRTLFADWVEPDVACYYMACLLGMLSFKPGWDAYRNVSGIFSWRSSVGTATFHLLECLVEEGLLESNRDGQYRWNPAFEENLEKKYEWWGMRSPSD